jgi:hypothetical protein
MNASEESDISDLIPSSQNTSDYIEIGYLIVLGVAGAVFNLIAYTNLDEHRKIRRFDRLLVLKQHMNYTDFMVIFLYTTSRVCWLMIYTWNGGNALCRLVKFGQALSFQVCLLVIAGPRTNRCAPRYFSQKTRDIQGNSFVHK